MRRSFIPVVFAVSATLSLGAVAAVPTIGGCPLFPANSIWNTRIDNLPVHPQSAAWVTSINTSTINGRLHLDFGMTEVEYGIPWVTVTSAQPGINVTFTEAMDETDPNPYPIPPDAPVEGTDAADPFADRHVIVLETTNCILHELYNATRLGGGAWSAAYGARFDLKTHALRPDGWTSADAAGLPILPGLLRYEEAASGEIAHALRFTAPMTQNVAGSYDWPARHRACNCGHSVNNPRNGARFRLKESFVIPEAWNPISKTIARAMKKYGLIVADNGTGWFITGTTSLNWPSAVFSQIQGIEGNSFEAVQTQQLRIGADSGQARQLGAIPQADADGNGKADIAWTDASGQAAVWLMDGTAPIGSALLQGPATGWSMARTTGDFNGDGRNDILWSHTDGRWAVWLMNGTAVISSALILGPSTGWAVTDLGDLDGDGRTDLVWRNTDGSAAAWLMNGLVPAASGVIFGPGTGWQVTHAGDLDGDGRTDLVWRNTDGSVSAWLMNGLAAASSAVLFGPGSSWQVTHLADTNGDGRADLAWKDGGGQVSLWLMNGLAASASAIIYSGGVFQLSHVADFDGDGKHDLAFRDPATGQVALWLMDGLAPTGSAIIFGGGGGWTVTHAVDFNGDGRADLLWRDAANQAAIWLQSGLATTGAAVIYGGTGAWQAGP